MGQKLEVVVISLRPEREKECIFKTKMRVGGKKEGFTYSTKGA